tara:strand:- start:1130 stop:2008 length:879 start_codon:yes stop_codon:yes gene_type:complete
MVPRSLYANKRKELDEANLEIEYYKSCLDTAKRHKNTGERDEILLAKKIYHYDEMKQYDKLIEIYGSDASEGVEVVCTETEVPITDINRIGKAGTLSKADIAVRMRKTKKIYHSSVKSKNGAPFAFLNHTPRSAKVFSASGSLNKHLPAIDSLLQEYICKRNEGTIKEDTLINNMECMKDTSIHSAMIDMMVYFMFDGTGSCESRCKADSLLYFHNDSISFVRCCSLEEKREYIESILDRCIISLRSKGMPTKIHDSCQPWIYEYHNDGNVTYKGSVHIRVDKKTSTSAVTY